MAKRAQAILFWVLFFTLDAVAIYAAVSTRTETGDYTYKGKSYATADECVKAITPDLGADPIPCDQTNRIIVTGTCDTPKPVWPADQSELVSVQDTADENVWLNYEKDWVPAPYPTCWAPGLVELKYPDRSAPSLPNVQEPMYRPALVGGVQDGEHP